MDVKTYLDNITLGGVDHKKVTWETTVTPAAAHKHHTLRKVTTALVMVGAEYKNLAVNADKQTGDLPWGKWMVYPHLIAHKGKDYARLYTVDGTLRTAYFVDDEVVSREDFLALLTPSKRDAARPNGGTITVNLDNIKAVK